jgi:hypothetical protein
MILKFPSRSSDTYTMQKDLLTNVDAAFEMLMEEIETNIALIQSAGARAFEAADYARAQEALERARGMTAFREEVSKLRAEWVKLQPTRLEDRQDKETRQDFGRLQRGLRTREAAYFEPILHVLVQSGGGGRMPDVLRDVERRMQSVLGSVDYDPLASLPDVPRWWNTAQWARHSLVKMGLMKGNSARGVWEISEAGRQWLRENS